VNGEITDSVSIGGASPPSGTSNTVITAGSIGEFGDITQAIGNIATVYVSTGNILGDIKANNGAIGVIDVHAGDIG
jgi:hypothetical protein